MAALLTGLGLLTRMATVTLFVTFTWIFLVCESNHNNHYILICHVTFVFSAIDWGRWGSLDSLLAAWRRRRSGEGGGGADVTVPYWHLLLAQLLFSIPYAFGAVAKLNEDWMLRAQPLKMWLAPHSHHTAWVPLSFGDSPLFPWAIAWGGFAFDLGIVPLLCLHVTRYTLAFPSAIAFNISNKMMFNIGVFPYAMLASLVLFLPPCPSLLERWPLAGATARQSRPPRTDSPGAGLTRTREESPCRPDRHEGLSCQSLSFRTAHTQVLHRARRCLCCAQREGEPRAVYAAALAPLGHAADDATARRAARGAPRRPRRPRARLGAMRRAAVCGRLLHIPLTLPAAPLCALPCRRLVARGGAPRRVAHEAKVEARLGGARGGGAQR